ncbi:MAG TPA: DUF302 domain-containing protein [Thermoleophilia bacterium]|nr:DUF302 domain-containing protein [Thermoleophilia bacterium]
MQAVEYGIGRELSEPYEAVLPRVLAALKAEGFGVITEIDVQKTMKEKLGVDGRPSVILGACNPKLAHAALGVEADLGLLLPCNVVVYETDTGTRVAAVNAGAMLSMVGNEALAPIAVQVQEGLDRVLASV